jgi:cell division protease FtsH
VRGRLEILRVHTRTIIISDEVDLEIIARQTPGFNGADLANVVNEAALLAARKEKDAVEMEDIQAAIERVIAGLEKKNRRLNEKEKDIVAYHESGHAIVTAALDSTDEVHKVSIVSRGMGALGYTLQVPLEDRYLMTKTELFTKICGLLGGRAAEEIIFGDISTGASNDLQRVTDLARRIVINFGMSERLGHVNYGDGNSGFLGEMGVRSRGYSEQTATTIDGEVHGLIAHLYQETISILRENRSILEEMADFLKEEEVLEGEKLKEMLSRVLQTGQVAPFGTDGSITGHGHP